MNQTQNPNDSFYDTVEKTPVKGGGANFKTHKLVQKTTSRFEFRPSGGFIAFCLVFIIPGLAIFIGGVLAMLFSWGELSGGIFLIPFGALFGGAGGGMLYYGAKPFVFDTSEKYFWKGWRAPWEVNDLSEIKTISPLSDIHCFQVVAEYISGEDSYYSYELNVVLKNGKRINVIDHGGQKALLSDADTISNLLQVPLFIEETQPQKIPSWKEIKQKWRNWRSGDQQ